MKGFLKTFSVALLVPTFAFGAALDIRMSQRNSSNTAWMDVVFAKQNGSIIGTNSTGLLSIITIGSGLDLTAGVLTATGGGGGAPTTATYITQTPNASLSNEQALSLLSSGLMRVATTTGAITSLGDPTTVGLSFMLAANPSAIRFPRVNSDNSVSMLSDSDFRTAIGAGTGSGTVTNNATLTAGRVALGGGTTVVGVLGAATNGQILIGNTTSGNMQLGTIIAGDNISVTLTAGGIMINATAGGGSGNVTNNASLTNNNIVIGNGTTGIGTTTMSWNSANSTVTIGSAGAGNIIANVATFQTGNFTTMNVTTLNLSTELPATVGGTGFSSTTAGNIIIGNNTTTYGQLAVGANGTVLTSNTSAPLKVSWEAASAGNVTAAGTLASGNIVIGQGSKATATTNITVSGNNTTLPGNLTAGGSIDLTSTLGTDDTYRAVTISGLNAGATIAQWEAVYLDGSSTWQLADANGSGTYPARGLAVAAYSSTDPSVVVREGAVRNDAWAWTPGGTIYLSAAAGGLTQTAPSTSGDKVQQVGFALTADIAYFNFASGEYLTIE